MAEGIRWLHNIKNEEKSEKRFRRKKRSVEVNITMSYVIMYFESF